MARHSASRRRSTARATSRVTSSGVLAATALGGAVAATGELAAVQPASGHTVMLEAFAPALAAEEPPAVRSGVVPVAQEPERLDVSQLVKAVRIAEREEAEAEAARKAEAREAARAKELREARTCSAGDSGFGPVKSWVSVAGSELRCVFGIDRVLGVASRASASDHPLGLALDFMVDRDSGNALASYALKNMDRLGVKYVIWRQRINYGSGWESMEDRGGATANHMDHVHISFDRRGPSLPEVLA